MMIVMMVLSAKQLRHSVTPSDGQPPFHCILGVSARRPRLLPLPPSPYTSCTDTHTACGRMR